MRRPSSGSTQGRPSVYIAYTGGTIGMTYSTQGYVPAKGYLSQRLASLPQFTDETMPLFHIHEYTPLLDSSNMRPTDWYIIANDIAANYEKYDGFVVLHGTDTMSYSASALSFLLENLSKPVIFTGSQIPICEVRSDAYENLVTSMLIAGKFKIPEVCLYINGRLLRGNRSQKIDASGYHAFDSLRYPILAEAGVNVEIYWNNILTPPTSSEQVAPITHSEQGGQQSIIGQLQQEFVAGEKFSVGQLVADTKIVCLRLFPGISADLVRQFGQIPIRGLVLETYGAGNAPDRDPELIDALKSAIEAGIVIVNVTQCHRGTVIMDKYATGNALKTIGVISGYDMTPEAALTKLYYLLSQDYSLEEVKQLMATNLRGELTD